jgi:hypothetical protein
VAMAAWRGSARLAPQRPPILCCRVLGIDGHTANRATRTYGFFEYGLTIALGRTTVLPFTIWMPKLDLAHQVTIPSPTAREVVVTTPYIPGWSCTFLRTRWSRARMGRP